MRGKYPSSTRLTWEERIQTALETDMFTSSDVNMCASWRTCAVGEFTDEEREKLSRFFITGNSGHVYHIPNLGTFLSAQGHAFTTAVEDHNVKRAKVIFDNIRRFVARKMPVSA